MNYFELMIHQSLILFVFYHSANSEQLQYALALDSVRIEGMQETWESVWLFKYNFPDSIVFYNDQLHQICGGAFTSSDVEILETFNRAMRFSLIRRTNEPNDQLFINVLFSKKYYVDAFFEDIRSNARQKHECGSEVKLEKMFQYQIMETENNEDPLDALQLLAHHVMFYPKDSDGDWFVDSKTFNFTRFGYSERSQGVLLVLNAKTFNISEEVGTNNYVLCSANIPTHKFILRFSKSSNVKYFFAFIKEHLNNEIPCPGDWITKDMVKAVNYKLFRGCPPWEYSPELPPV